MCVVNDKIYLVARRPIGVNDEGARDCVASWQEPFALVPSVEHGVPVQLTDIAL